MSDLNLQYHQRGAYSDIPRKDTLRQPCKWLASATSWWWWWWGKHTSAKHDNIVFRGDIFHDGYRQKEAERSEDREDMRTENGHSSRDTYLIEGVGGETRSGGGSGSCGDTWIGAKKSPTLGRNSKR